MSIAEALAARVEELLKQHNITQYRLSMLSGVSQATISDIRLKKNRAVNVRILYELSQGFGMDLADFFDNHLFRNGNITD